MEGDEVSNVTTAFLTDVIEGRVRPACVAGHGDCPHLVMRHLSRPPLGGGFLPRLADFEIASLPSYTRNEPQMYSYVVEVTICGRLFYKVGVTQNVRNRVRSIVSALPPAVTDLRSVSAGVHNIASAPNVEKEVLASFSDRWAGGEWITDAAFEVSR
jgi:hypothetical protein